MYFGHIRFVYCRVTHRHWLSQSKGVQHFLFGHFVQIQDANSLNQVVPVPVLVNIHLVQNWTLVLVQTHQHYMIYHLCTNHHSASREWWLLGLKTTGAAGLVPAYGLLDMNTAIRFSKNLELRININNVTNKQYFTKRPTFYPGPGVWPSDGINFSVSFAVRL